LTYKTRHFIPKSFFPNFGEGDAQFDIAYFDFVLSKSCYISEIHPSYSSRKNGISPEYGDIRLVSWI